MPEPQAKATAGQIMASGTVEDSSGEPLIGASVMVAGTSMGSTTDFDGNFSIKVPSGSKLLISYVGYKPIEVAAGEHLRVVLTEDSEVLDEVVVVGYGTQKKTTLTGAVGGVKGDEVLKSPVANIQQSLTGRIPGLATTVTSGEPGADDVTFWLRGAGTVNGTAPLILVDGVPRDNMRVIDPREVESISVLKDASATAVFGVRGANGVILITTKRGKKGKLEVSASFEYSIQEIAHREKTLDSYTFALLKNEGLRNDGIVSTDSRYYSEADLAAYQSWLTGDPTDPVGHPNTNWMDVLFRDYAPQTRANVVLNGGSESTQYFVSAGYTYQGGMFNVPSKDKVGYNANTNLNRYNFRSNVDHQISKYLKASLDISSYIEKVNKPARSGDNIYPWAYVLRPTTPGPVTPEDNPYPFEYNGQLSEMAPGMLVVDENGRNDPSAYGNLTRTGYEKQTRAGVNVIGNLILDLSFITPGLSTRGLVSFESKANTYQFAAKDYAAYYLDRTQEDYVWKLADVNKPEDGELSPARAHSQAILSTFSGI
ncbi:MAG: SusC/RagA family TonB-linked outer membrane protein [Duncaniella sp.]|uniref:SusC/RagA family TonB-linked outer membrane protein n=1 Tax=Duncaniella sp. TaxID=2518496 RepID=UPI0023C0EF0B|nr:SusC/RagA family TonB-linked outer membrane protein [Duncaniella sp.]MDE6089778.1 SusC/RagA family TonB-linked outer membrane protein [Duncaniella sp.]